MGSGVPLTQGFVSRRSPFGTATVGICCLPDDPPQGRIAGNVLGRSSATTGGACATANDMAGELWRVSEQHSINCYDVPMLYATVEVHSDLKSGRYLVLGLRDGQPRFFENIKRSSADYTPAVLRMLGVR